MGLIQHRQIKDRIVQDFIPQIDVSDVTPAMRENAQISRGLCALALTHLADVDIATSSASIVDGFGDNGVDCIYYDAGEKILYLLQSKWNNNHTGSVENGDVLKFLQGAKDLMNSRYEKFNDKVNARRAEIDKALGLASRVVIATVYSGSGSFSEENKASINGFVDDVDDTRELVNCITINQSILHSYIIRGAQGATITDEVKLFYWGMIDEPVRAYYGQVSASDLAQLSKKYGHKLFSKNIRMFLGGDSAVNRGISDTISNSPEHFWYFNNGVTALATSIHRKAIGGASRDSGQFQCEGLTIVNGAQTVGSIASLIEECPEQLTYAKVPMRIISLEGAPDGFSTFITRNNNTQNRIDPRNFVALDPEQERLKIEFMVDGIEYEFRQGEIEHSSGTRLGLVEATVALACTDSDLDLSTQAKREIGRLWEDISRPPYKKLFNGSVSSDAIWTRVKAFRRIDGAISVMMTSSDGKRRNILIHGNRFLCHVSYQRALNSGIMPDLSNLTDKQVSDLVSETFSDLINDIQEHYSEGYIASLFKNQTKCREMKGRLV